jgi:hypothetical protein
MMKNCRREDSMFEKMASAAIATCLYKVRKVGVVPVAVISVLPLLRGFYHKRRPFLTLNRQRYDSVGDFTRLEISFSSTTMPNHYPEQK